jgi:Fur family ferric uptake transcriptional regulator
MLTGMARKPIISNALLELMRGGDHHAWTLEDLQAGLARREIASDFSTVYRAAEKLVADGMAAKLMLEDGRARFELALAHHDHLHCTGCDELIAVPCLLEPVTFARLETEVGVTVAAHQVMLSGLCQTCARTAPSA